MKPSEDTNTDLGGTDTHTHLHAHTTHAHLLLAHMRDQIPKAVRSTVRCVGERRDVCFAVRRRLKCRRR